MRKFNPVYLAAAVAIAVSGPAALAQTTGGSVRTAPSGVTTTTGTTPAARAAAAPGNCTGTAGSSCTATNSNSPSTSGTATTTSTTPTPGVSDTSNAGTALSTQATGVGNSSSGVSGSAMGTNQTTVDPATTRPGSFAPGGTFGPADTNAPGTANVPSTLTGTSGAVLIPNDGNMGNPSQQSIVIQNQPAPQPERALTTPLLDQTTREAQARETRRRNAKQEPRIIGIAPNTDRDLTNQMPDDRIIRY